MDFKLIAHWGMTSYTMYAVVKHTSSLFFLAANFNFCSLIQQKILIFDSTPKWINIYYSQFWISMGFNLSILLYLIPAPRGIVIVSAPVQKKLILMTGIDNCYTSAGVVLPTWANLPRSLLMPSTRPTATWPLTSGKRLFTKSP